MIVPSPSLGAALTAAQIARGPRVEQGDLVELVLTHRDNLPGQDSQAFVPPDPGELAPFAAAVLAALAEDLAGAAAVLATFGYELSLFDDITTANRFLVLSEREPRARCWGLFLFNLAPAAHDLLVEVPHPIWDSRSPELGIELFQHLGARSFLIAGAHRYANGLRSPISDLARNERTVFQTLHKLLSQPSTHVLQIHGFKFDNHPTYPNIVLSNGSAQPHPELFRLGEALEARGESVGVFNGAEFSALAGTSNPQAAHTRSIGGRFYHFESRFGVRNRPERRAAVIEAARAAILS